MGDWNLELPKHKARKLGQADVRERTTAPKRKPKPWKVMRTFLGRVYVAHRSVTREAAEAWIEKQARSYYVHSRTASVKFHEESAIRARERAARYTIVGPV